MTIGIIDPSMNFKMWPNTISVTYLSKTGEKPPLTGPTITNVLWTAIRKGHLPSDSILMQMDRTFRIARALLRAVLPGPIVPKEFDIIVDDLGLRWVVGPANGCIEILDWGTSYRLHCKKTSKQGIVDGKV